MKPSIRRQLEDREEYKEVLYYFHGFFNRELFDGRLSPVVIYTGRPPGWKEGMEATIMTRCEPMVIYMPRETPKQGLLHALTILLHEMVHQSLEEDWGNAWEPQGNLDRDGHGPIFRERASQVGMINGGYGLEKELENTVKEELSRFLWMRKVARKKSGKGED